MKPSLLATLILLVVSPMLLLGGMGVRLARVERLEAEQRFRQVVEARLAEIDGRIVAHIRALEDQMLRVAGEEMPLDAKRESFAATGLVRTFFAVNPQGELVYPTSATPGTEDFFRRTEVLWQSAQLPFSDAESPAAQAASVPAGPGAEGSGPAAGWYTWYWGHGLQFLYWWRGPAGGLEGVELNRARLIADLIAILPDTAPPQQPGGEAGRVRLLDAQGQPLYEWGGHSLVEGERPFLAAGLSAPMQAWQVQYFVPSGSLPSVDSAAIGFVLLILACGACLILLGVYFYRESSRALRDAAQRVSFVNHVSHELKTPLTNIRLYAEVLQEELGEQEPLAHHAGVIAQESQRLSRLIGNLLTFARKQRRQLAVHPKPECIDGLIAGSVTLHQPRMKAQGLEIALNLDAGREVPVDRDAFEQILYNLLSNAEKYAPRGGEVSVTSFLREGLCVVEVCDGGPGLAPQERERIFGPFYRIPDRLNEGVSGTGLGLSLARELARLHGGELECLGREGAGACFRLTLPLPAQKG